MKKKLPLQKILIISILALMAFTHIGSFLKFHQEQEERKAFVKALFHKNLSDEKFTVIDYFSNKNEIYWEEEGAEFFYKGEMYDIVKTKRTNGKTLFYCLNDKKEKEFIAHFYAQKQKETDKDNKAKSDIGETGSIFIMQDSTVHQTCFHTIIFTYNNFTSSLSAGISNRLFQPPSLS